MKMTIRRKTQEFGLPAGVIEIELTEEEIEQAYRIQERNYRLQDAENALRSEYDAEKISDEEMERLDGNEEFYEAALAIFEKNENCNIPENTIWEIAIEKAKEDFQKQDRH